MFYLSWLSTTDYDNSISYYVRGKENKLNMKEVGLLWLLPNPGIILDFKSRVALHEFQIISSLLV